MRSEADTTLDECAHVFFVIAVVVCLCVLISKVSKLEHRVDKLEQAKVAEQR